jgi:hypothetical protein
MSTPPREFFDAAIAAETDPDSIAKLELLREYFHNPTFRKALEGEVYRINTANGEAA